MAKVKQLAMIRGTTRVFRADARLRNSVPRNLPESRESSGKHCLAVLGRRGVAVWLPRARAVRTRELVEILEFSMQTTARYAQPALHQSR